MLALLEKPSHTETAQQRLISSRRLRSRLWAHLNAVGLPMRTASPATRLIVLVFALAGAAGASLRAQLPAPEPTQTFRSAVDVVTIQASVRDARGRALAGLRAADFEVRDNGQLRPVLSLRADQHSPLSLAFLVDMSGSMSVGAKIDMARRAFDGVLSQLRENDDEAAVFTFDSTLHERQDFTGNLATLRNALSDFQPFGTTSLYDATASTARRLADRTGARKAIILLTDGIDTSSSLTATEVSGLASSIDVPVYVIATIPSIDERVMIETTDRRGGSAADYRDLAEWTGGRLVFASSFWEATTVAATLVTDLREQYVLAIEAAGAHEWRRLDVRVRRPSTVVKARSGYFGG
jgi:VWFA-related protein